MNHRTIGIALVATLAVTALAGCMSASGSTGTASVFVKDAPTDDVTHVYVTFSKVQLHQTDNDSEREEQEREEKERDDESARANVSAAPGHGRIAISIEVQQDNDTDNESAWITVMDKPTTVDLLAFNGSASAFLGDADVPVGAYNQIRLTVDSASLTLKDGSTANVTVPGHNLRIKGHFTVDDGKETKLTIDFDLDRSLHQTGNGKWMLKPVLHLESEKGDRPHDDERRERMRERDAEDERSRHAKGDD
ncbi:MAG: DUF4382 domain-containing protein [bacterium]